ncbi:MAG: hypothetical protein WCT37_02915 [Patescibacteria group bacterium]|jgi:hypothetical protein
MLNKKETAIKLRQAGQSYNEISKKLAVAKGTLSYWFKGLAGFDKIKEKNLRIAKQVWAANITAFNKKRAATAREKWLVDQKMAAKEITTISSQELLLIGTALYWAEGYKKGKWNVVFSNSDPMMNRLMIIFFTKICQIPKDKIKAQIQLHHQNQVAAALDYWPKIINLPLKQFLKPNIQISRRSKLRRGNTLPYGTLRIKIDNVKLLNKIKGWIIGLEDNIGV